MKTIDKRIATLEDAFFKFFFVQERYDEATDGDYKLNKEISQDAELLKAYRAALARINRAKSCLKGHSRLINRAHDNALETYKDYRSVRRIGVEGTNLCYYA